MNATATPELVDDGFVVELDRFQGPLELLLHLIREQDIDIFDIPIARVTEQFLRAIEGVERIGIDRAGEFLEMAATLVRIKAQMLLPRHGDDAEDAEDPRTELVRRLLEYEHFMEVARRLEHAEVDRSRHYARGYVPPRPEPKIADAPLETTWDDLWNAVLELAERTRAADPHRVTQRAVPLEEKLALILDTLKNATRVEFRRLVAPFNDRRHSVVTFLAGLELAKQRFLMLRQSEAFGPLWYLRRDEEEAGPAEREDAGGEGDGGPANDDAGPGADRVGAGVNGTDAGQDD